MNLESVEQIMVQTMWAGTWQEFREFDTEEAAREYILGDHTCRVVKRTVVTIKGEWEVVP